jgi:predicted PurR-regulated permease PerM
MTGINISDRFLRRIVYTIGVMMVIVLGFYTFSLLRTSIIFILNVLSPFLASLLLAYILAPLVIKLQRNLKLGRIVGTLLLYLLIFMIMFLLIAFLVPKIFQELSRLFEAIKEEMPKLLAWLSENTNLKLDSEFIRNLKDQIENITIDYQEIVSSIFPAIKTIASGGFSAIGGATKGFFSGIGFMVSFFSFMIFVGIISFYFIVDWEKIRPIINKMVPLQHRGRTFDILDKIDEAMGGFLRGQLTVAVIVGMMFAAGLFGMSFIGFPALTNYAILIGTVAGVAGFIPYLGAVIGVAPAILIIILTGGVEWSVKLFTFAGVLMLFSLIQAVEGFVLQPKIIGKSAGLHPLVVILALIIGSQFGIGGLIIAVPLASVIRVLVREFYWIPIERRELNLIRNIGQRKKNSIS